MNVGDVYFEKNIVTKVNTNGRGVEMETKRVDVSRRVRGRILALNTAQGIIDSRSE